MAISLPLSSRALVGDCLFVKPDNPGEEPYIARAVAIRKDEVKLQWYYKPNDTVSGRQVRPPPTSPATQTTPYFWPSLPPSPFRLTLTETERAPAESPPHGPECPTCRPSRLTHNLSSLSAFLATTTENGIPRKQRRCLWQSWHGDREVFESTLTDWNPLKCVEGKCRVHTLEEYEELKKIRPEDHFSRFSYNPTTGNFKPETTPVYCICELPQNPDRDMVMCERCRDWFHCDCVHFNPKENPNTLYVCDQCVKHDSD